MPTPASSSASAPEDYAQAGNRDERHRRAVHPLDGIEFQRRWESRAFELGGGEYFAPGQLVGDFLRRQRSTVLGRRAAVVHARRAPDRSRATRPRQPAGLRARSDPRGDAGLRPADQGLRDGRTRCSPVSRRARRRRCASRAAADLQSVNVQRTVSGRRGRRICGRHHVGRSRRHRDRRGGCAHAMLKVAPRCSRRSRPPSEPAQRLTCSSRARSRAQP